ncbi:IS6 family transposase [Streptomyces sp. NPDC050388]|uniref:IS6 family transposase n=1 Tax=Streptomyces sp. NPDC050388 TaxID=3155781 RepID=UPI00342B9E72
MDSASPSCQGHQYPVEIISHCVWRYFRFPLSYRGVEELMLERGVLVSHETVRRRCATSGQTYVSGLRRRPRPGDTGHLDEVFIKIDGERQHLWRAVDRDGTVLDVLVQNRRDTAAARRFFHHPMKTTRAVPRVIVTDKLRSYDAAHREAVPSVEHRQSKYLNNRAENSHQPCGCRIIIRRGQAACPYSWRVPPHRSRLRILRRLLRAGMSITSGSGRRGAARPRARCGRCPA